MNKASKLSELIRHLQEIQFREGDLYVQSLFFSEHLDKGVLTIKEDADPDLDYPKTILIKK